MSLLERKRRADEYLVSNAKMRRIMLASKMAPHKRFFDLQAMASGSFRCRKNVASLFCTKAFSLFAHFGIVLLRLFAGFPLPNQSVFSATCFICHILNGHHFMSTNTSLKFAKV
jgi:hypothetical protein